MPRSLQIARRVSFFLLLVACGSRTGLFFDEQGTVDDDARDAGSDARGDASGITDAPPPLDVRPPLDVDRTNCPDAEALLVYTMTDTRELQSFDPATGQFQRIGTINCPTTSTDQPFSMAVDRRGVAYVLFQESRRIFRVSTLTSACIGTPYVRDQSNFQLFGMGFATNAAGPTETLYVAGDERQGTGGTNGLARIDPSTFQLSPVGVFAGISAAELTGTGDGRLFAFYRKGETGLPSYIGEIDTATAAVLGERRFDTVDQGRAWAFAYWGGDFYMFHAPTDTTRVTRFRPADDSVTEVATTPLRIVGAGVSTCAPQD